ncbi:AraC family transcriptional regulator [Acetatifactor muris]|uniref:HTH-type transcriptional activator RhaS n=1 Tax=Acetatifactor muris TaxID=879566 RepID=A0A2K4ZEM1_9FIRM|nr:AraC family transcriptional regulator [Acetatifactor muris]MCR2048519.1 AraC family transcriptional regulator [Acetatifactor muris]SOY28911.1 HTH-type transcriptional activator RhaS [Acetatifactor muris]
MIKIEYCGYHTHNPDQALIYRPSGTASYLFLLVLSPMCFQFPDHESVNALPGACILYEPDFYQHYQAEKHFFNSYVHFFAEKSMVDSYHMQTNTLFYPSNIEEIHWILKKIYQEFLNGQQAYGSEMIDLYVQQLLIQTAREQLQRKKPNEQYPNLYHELLSIRGQMLNSCEDPWCIDQLCKILNLGKSQLYKYYNAYFHCSPMDELIRARLQKACFLLTNEASTVREAAFESGFQNINHFNRLFRKAMGCTPGEYRKQKSS